MSSFFSIDNAFFRLMTKVVHIFFLNLLWLLFSLPIVTIGAATTALNTVTLKMVRGEEGYILSSFWKAFKQNLKAATVLWLLIVVGFMVLVGDIVFFSRMGNWFGVICAGLFFAGVLSLALVLMVVFHLQAYFSNSVKGTLRDAFRLAFGQLPYSMALLVLFCSIIYAIYVSVPLMLVFTLFGSGLFSYVSAYLLRKLFDRFEEQKTITQHD